MPGFRFWFLGFLFIAAPAFLAGAESLAIPPRPSNAPTGSQVVQVIERMTTEEREARLWHEILRGNVPGWNRTFVSIPFSGTLHGSNYSGVFRVLPEYLAVGSDSDYFLSPMTPRLAQRLADKLGCSLPTRRMVNMIWTNSAVKLNPQPIPPSAAMTTVPVFAAHNQTVRGQRDQTTNSHPLGALVSGHKKDVVISTKIYTNFATAARHPVVIYGWHYLSGQPIQPLYNGHGDTYADYSHGIRLVQTNVSLNGGAVPLASLLTNASMAGLLSDESSTEGTTNGVIAVPRYTVAPVAPSLIEHPRSITTRPGKMVLLSAPAAGDEPLSWSWQHEGSPAIRTDTPTLVLTNPEAAHAGRWTAVVSNAYGSVTSRPAILRMESAEFPVLFHDDFESPQSENWQVRWGAANAVPDFNADLTYDHRFQVSIISGFNELIPSAPNSQQNQTRAARLAVNAADAVGAACAVNIFSNQRFSNDFAFKCDCWMNYPGGAGGINSTGSTQHALFGVNHTGLRAAWSGALTSDGLWFAASGEGGDERDYRNYEGNTAGPVLEWIGVSSGLVASNHTAPLFQILFPPDRFETPGAPGKQWVAVELRSSNNIVSWLYDGRLIARKTNQSTFHRGSVMLGLVDIFPSIANPARDSFLLLDNVRVEDLSGRTRILEAGADGDEFRMLFSAVPGRQYEVQSSSNLLSWVPAALLTASEQPLEYQEAALSARRFFRVQGPLQ